MPKVSQPLNRLRIFAGEPRLPKLERVRRLSEVSVTEIEKTRIVQTFHSLAISTSSSHGSLKLKFSQIPDWKSRIKNQIESNGNRPQDIFRVDFEFVRMKVSSFSVLRVNQELSSYRSVSNEECFTYAFFSSFRETRLKILFSHNPRAVSICKEKCK